MTAKGQREGKIEESCFSTWRCTISGQDYKQQTKVRNQAKWECRKAQNKYEKKLAKEGKKNPKAFYKYTQSKLKTITDIAHLTQEDGSLTKTDKQKADVLNIFFSSVFTREDTNNMPNTFTSRTDSELIDIQFDVHEM